MTDESVSSSGSPREMLDTVRRATRRVRIAQRGSWFPLLVLAGVTLAAIPVYRFGPHHLGGCRSGPDGTSVCASVVPAVVIYWPFALVLAYALIAGFYLFRSRRRGVGTLVRPYVAGGAALAVLVAAASWWRQTHPGLAGAGTGAGGTTPPPTLYDLATPAAAIGLALVVLARVERNPALLAFSLVYLAVVVADSARVIHSSSAWWFLPHLLVPAGVLLIGSAGFALAEAARRPRAR